MRAAYRVHPLSILTARELHVCASSDRPDQQEIAEELCLSERTIDRHVSNILDKLDVPSRAAAAAHASIARSSDPSRLAGTTHFLDYSLTGWFRRSAQACLRRTFDLREQPAERKRTRHDMYDAIIVGARCAGAPAAMLLARKGYRVLVVDRASFPSDTISTHIIWPHGAAVMDSWGLFDRLAATGCPPVALNLIFDVGPFALSGGVVDTNAGRGGFCPRRTVLDKLLVDAAVEAGAELREGFTRRDAALGRRSSRRHQGPRPDGRHGRGAGASRDRRGRHALAGGQGRPSARVRHQAAAHHELLQLLQRIRGRRSRRVRPRLPGSRLLPDARAV